MSLTNGALKDARAAAGALIAEGCAPIPVPHLRKKPTLTGWPALRLKTPDLDAYFPDGAPTNLGHLNGEPSGGRVDVDKDCAEVRAAAPFLLPPTDLVSGRESAPDSHNWYQVDAPPAKATEEYCDPLRTEDGLMVELRSTGGMTLVPPSTYPADAKKGHPKPERCVWHRHGAPGRVTIAELRSAVGATAAAALLGRYWPRSRRHACALSLAGGLLRRWEVARVEAFVRAVCAAARDEEAEKRLQDVRDTAERLRAGEHVTGFPNLVKELGANGKTIMDAVGEWLDLKSAPDPRVQFGSGRGSEGSRVTPQRYRPIPEYVPFPTECLPAPWDAFVREGAAALQCDEALVALPLLAVLAGAVGNTRRVYLGGEWFEPAILWTCVIAESGSMKTSAANLSLDLVRARQKRLMKAFKDAMKEYKRLMREWKEAEGAKDEDEPEKPSLERIVVADVTIEKLAGLHDDSRRGLLVARDELAGWFGSFTKYKGKGGGTDEPNWLSMHRGDAIVYDRKTGEKTSIFVPHAATSVTGGVQPGVLRRLASNDLFESGMVARIVFAMPPRTPKQWSEHTISDETRAAANVSLEALYELRGVEDEDGDPCPVVVKLSADARRRLRDFVNAWGVRQFEAEGERAAALAKLEAMPGRFALVRHLVRTGGGADYDAIGLDDLEAGIRLAEWSARECERVYAILAESSEETEIRKLVELVTRIANRNDGRVTVKLLQRANQRKYATADAAKADLERLVSLDLGDWESAPERAGGGWRPTYFILRPRSCVTRDSSYPCSDDGDDDGDLPASDGCPDAPPNAPPPSDVQAGASGDSVSDCDENDEAAVGQGYEESRVTHDRGAKTHVPKEEDVVGGESHTSRESRVTHAPTALVATAGGVAELAEVVSGWGGPVGLDTETTGLDPTRDRVRLIQVATTEDVAVVDVFALPDPAADLAPLFAALAGKEVVGHNLGFDLSFLSRLGFVPGRLFDTMLASQVLDAGSDRTVRHGLKDVAARHLGADVAKELQRADWSGALSAEMLGYAARDAQLPLLLRDTLAAATAAARLTPTVEAEMAALPCVVWGTVCGVGFDRAAWEPLAAEAEAEVGRLADALDAAAPGPHTLTATTNWNSPEQVVATFKALGITLTSTDDDALAAVAHPVAELLREYRAAAKLSGTYGREWLRHVASDGRVYATWKQIGAGASGRMSCKEPNLQQLPRDPRYRKCFAAPPGRVLVKADYSQIELRIAAKLTGDKRMLDAYRKGEDLHTLTARALLGKDDVTKADRQLAKAINFGLLYGMGAKNLTVYARSNYGVAITEQEAGAHRDTFFRTYPGLRKWHRSVREGAVETRTLAGRRRSGVERYTEKLNTPVQGTGADGLKRALALLWERRAACPGAFPVLFVHDEIVVECAEGQQADATAWVRDAMRDGMSPLIAPVSVEVEVTAGRTWGG